MGVLEFGLGESASTPSLYSPNLLMKFSLYFHPWMEAKGQQHKFIMLSLCVHASILLGFFFLLNSYFLFGDLSKARNIFQTSLDILGCFYNKLVLEGRFTT